MSVRLQRKTIQLLGCAALSLLAVGCSGINASKSVSPLDFLIPGGGSLWKGLLYVPPPAPPVLPDPAIPVGPSPEATKQLALVR
jgi:hypothetical protein